ncbi:uncharacterized protein LOC122366746 [Amphibalanus amphitrite]|uniref:uncharacterized protein LOC122366746 n=1 Tax=Amphibalanus amphitrite TaxID=1232801 RepID=UPI001C90BA4B|nr:uncharacterized protein LOC122366746 [Amphibalanus amphitrite]
MPGPCGRHLHLLVVFLLGFSSVQEARAQLSANATEPPLEESVWMEVEDGTLEIRDFSGPVLPPPPLFEQGTALRIIDSTFDAIPEATFPMYSNVSNATLELTNTTIGEWGANDMKSFTSITITNCTIRQLGHRAVQYMSGLAWDCRQQDPERGIAVTFSGTTIQWVDRGGVMLDGRRALLHITDSTLGALETHAFQLGLVTELRLEDTIVGALAVDPFCRVCSSWVTLEHNQFLHVPPHALHFGSSACAPSRGNPHCEVLYSHKRQVAVNGTRLSCAQLGWLREALRLCGVLSEHTSKDYRQFGDSSHCSDRNESVSSFLLREPAPRPGPEPSGGWCYHEGTIAGVATALAVGFLAVGFLAARCLPWGRPAGTFCSRRADSCDIQETDDKGISLPLQPTGTAEPKAKAADSTDVPSRSADGRYAAYPVQTPSRQAATGTPQQQRGRFLPSPAPDPAAQPARQRSPRPTRPAKDRQAPPSREQPRREPRRAAAQPPSAAEPVYENQDKWLGGDQEPVYANQQWPVTEDEPGTARHIYGNLHNTQI